MSATRELALQWAIDHHNHWTMWGRNNTTADIMDTASKFYLFLVTV